MVVVVVVVWGRQAGWCWGGGGRGCVDGGGGGGYGMVVMVDMWGSRVSFCPLQRTKLWAGKACCVVASLCTQGPSSVVVDGRVVGGFLFNLGYLGLPAGNCVGSCLRTYMCLSIYLQQVILLPTHSCAAALLTFTPVG